MSSLYDRVENIEGKVENENAGYQHFLLFPQCFRNDSIPDLIKPGIVWEKVNDPEEKAF